MKTSPELGRLVDQTLAVPVGPFAFVSVLERLFQLDIHKQRTRHLTRCLLIGTLSYDSFLIWWWLLLQDALPWAAAQMLGIATPFALLVVVLLQVVPTRWRETLASLPFYVGLVVVYNMVINGPPGREMNQTLFIFTWPLMLAFVNTCMKSPLLPALLFNGFALSVIALAVHEAPVSPIVGGLMMTNAIVMAFFSLLASYWLTSKGAAPTSTSCAKKSAWRLSIRPIRICRSFRKPTPSPGWPIVVSSARSSKTSGNAAWPESKAPCC